MSLVFRWIFLLHHLHVLLDVITEDSVLMRLRIILRICTLLLGWLVAREVLGVVRNMQSTIYSSLERSPHARANASSANTHVKNALQRALICLFILNMKFLAISFLIALESTIQAELLQSAAGNEQTSCIGGSIIFVATRNAKFPQFCRCGLAHDFVSSNGRVGNLANYFSVRETNNEPVFLVVVLVLVLANHLSASLEICLAFAATTLLHLEALKECCILQDLDERHDSL
mmetsp:Transcript_121046/g.189899  ORF Transcript_121046/g.189899 Transcript_121046/m.189899 type:complete len:231 (+) Transcript_121046:328-1020(+)